LGNDQEWYNAFDEAASWATSSQLRQLFVTMLLFCEVTDEYAFLKKCGVFFQAIYNINSVKQLETQHFICLKKT